jgi:hypothetical protein
MLTPEQFDATLADVKLSKLALYAGTRTEFVADNVTDLPLQGLSVAADNERRRRRDILHRLYDTIEALRIQVCLGNWMMQGAEMLILYNLTYNENINKMSSQEAHDIAINSVSSIKIQQLEKLAMLHVLHARGLRREAINHIDMANTIAKQLDKLRPTPFIAKWTTSFFCAIVTLVVLGFLVSQGVIHF